jgi:glycosyltransferase involved in cell wall biosynthesis
MNSLLHIAPQLPPAIDGVGDYCWNLWRHWPEAEPDWQFVVARGAEESAAHWPQVAISGFALNARGLESALECAGAGVVVLHYVGYGFQPKGIPLWLPRALRTWRQANSRHRLVTMFHETYARSSPLRSPFWVAPFARKIMRALARHSDAWVTSCERYLSQSITEFSADPRLGHMIPIGSNVLAAGSLSTSSQRRNGKLRVVIFGLSRTRLWALERHWRLLRALSKAGRIAHVTLLGQSPGPDDERMMNALRARVGNQVSWRERFNLSAPDLSEELSAHDCGLLANEPDILTKSGVFAALAGHGVVPIVSARVGTVVPELLRQAVLVNDDAQSIGEIIERLGVDAVVSRMRTGIREFAERELSWSRIAAQWRDVLGPYERSASVPDSPHVETKRLGPVISTLEVSA